MLVRDPVAAGGERSKILDFGIAKLTQGQGTETATNAVIGTPQYMSPEQCRGAGGVDDRTDVYALGVILYEMLAGRPPFVGMGAIEYMAQHSFDEPPPLRQFAPTVPADLIDLVHQLLIKNKLMRPAMHAVAARLQYMASRLSGAMPVAVMPVAMMPVPVYQEPSAPLPVSPTIIPGPSSTLGGFPAQTIPPTTRPGRRMILGLGAGVGLVAALGVLGFGWLGAQDARPTVPARVQPRESTVKRAPLPPPTVDAPPPVADLPPKKNAVAALEDRPKPKVAPLAKPAPAAALRRPLNANLNAHPLPRPAPASKKRIAVED